MLVTAVEKKEFGFFSHVDEQEIRDTIYFQYETLSENYDEIPIPYAQDLIEGLIELYIDEMICRQLETDDVAFLPDAQELTEIRMKNDDDAWDQVITDALDALMSYNLFNHPVYGNENEKAFARDILMILDENRMGYISPASDSTSLEGKDFFHDKRDDCFIIEHCPIQEVW